MRIDGWNHNSHYHARLLAVVPPQCLGALDVGCGLGAFARRLATVVQSVDALDSDTAILGQARQHSAAAPNLRFIEADFMTWQTRETYEFISMVAVLHHLPFEEALERAAALLRPAGVLAVLGLDRNRSLVHAGMRSLVAYPLSCWYRITRPTSPVGARIVEPTLTLRQIRQRAEATLPGAVIRRHVLWRYSLIWRKPASNRDRIADSDPP